MAERESAPAGRIVDRLKEAGSHTVIYGLGSVLQTALGFVLIPIYTRQFSPGTYGIFSLVTLVGTVAGAIWALGAASALGRSYFDYPTEQERRAVVGTSLRITLAGAAIQLALGVVFSALISRMLFGTSSYALHVFVAIAASAVNSLNNVFFVLLRFLRRSREVVALNLLSLLTTTGLILYFLLVMKWGVMAPLAGMLAGRMLVGAALVWVAREQATLSWTQREVRAQLAYGIPNMVAGLMFYGLDSIDRLFINHYMTLDDVGVYSLGYKIAAVIQFFFVMPFSQIWAPMRVEYRHERNAPELFSLVLTYFWLIGVFLTVAISGFAVPAVSVISGNEAYLGASDVIPVVMLAQLVYGTINIVDNGIVFERKMMYHVYGFAFALAVNMGLNATFIPRWGYMAAAWSTLLCYALVAGIAGGISNGLYPVRWEWKRLVHGTMTALAAFAAMPLVQDGVPSVLWRMAVMALLLGWWYILLLSKRERSWVERVLLER